MKRIVRLMFILVLVVNAYAVNANACDLYCSTCEDCNSKINSAGSGQTICLNASINYTGTCINPSYFNTKTFDCQGNTIMGNTYMSFSHGWSSLPTPTSGILLSNAHNATIRNCIISGFYNGIALDFSSNNTLINTTTYSNHNGIVLKYSPNNFLRNDTMFNNSYNFNIFGSFYEYINTSSVDGKPIYYWTNKNAPNGCKNAEISDVDNAGFVALVSCDNITVKNLNLSKNSHGILLVNTKNSKILNNTIRNTYKGTFVKGGGIYLLNSQNNLVTNNTLTLNKNGIYLDYSSNNTLTNNTANDDNIGIHLGSSSHNTLINNTAKNNDYGIDLDSSSHNTLINNTANNNGNGIYLSFSSNNNIIINNTLTSSGTGIYILNSHSNKILENKILENSHGITLSIPTIPGHPSINMNNTIERNKILYNNIGISSKDSNSNINSNVVCENDLDFNSSDWGSSLGYNNTCDKPDGWNDNGKTGCTNACKISCNCSTYNQCKRKLDNSNCRVVTLLKDITLKFSPININNKTFDCHGHRIVGSRKGDRRSKGIIASKGVIKNCVITNFTYGIYLINNSSTIINNTLTLNNYGVYISLSSNNTIINNTIKENSEFDVYVNFYKEPLVGDFVPDYSDKYCNNVLENNIGSGDTLIKYFNHSINLSNETLSELILCNADNSSIKNVTITGSDTLKSNGLLVFLTENSNLTNINSSNNKHGVYLEKSSNNVLMNITANLNSNYGIYLKNSQNNIINNSKTNLNNNGIFLQKSLNITIINSTANSNKEYGIFVYKSSNNVLINNTADSNIHGIRLEHSPNNIMRDNTMKYNIYNFGIFGWDISNFYQDIDTSNLVDNKPIYYWTNKNAPNGCKNAEISDVDNAGFVALVSCNNITVKNLNLSKNSHGILLVNTTNSKILNNIIHSNYYGIRLFSSSNNTLNSNTACGNTFMDFYVDYYSNTNTGKDNTCKLAAWKDSGKQGCSYGCSGVICNCKILLGFGGKISPSCNCCTQFDFDNNSVIDIFDAVAGLEYLSGERDKISNMDCSDINNNGIDLIDIFYLIEKLHNLH